VALGVTRADRGDLLADALAGRLADPLPDPLQAELVVVHSRGVERWLSQRLSGVLGVAQGGDGICANVRFPFPREVVHRAIRGAGADDPDASPWAPDRLVWPLLELVASGGVGAWGAPLLARLDADPQGRLSTLRAVADALDRLAVHRPDVVLDWLDGRDVAPSGGALPDGAAWQPPLLRALRDHVGRPTLPELVVRAVADMAGPGDLPPRLSLFGFTALPAAHLAVLVALSRVADVDLYLLHPSAALWDRWAGLRGGLDDRGLPVLPARGTAELPPPAGRLLRSWGRDAVEMQVVVQTLAPGTAVRAVRGGPPPATLLGRLQDAVRRDADIPAGTAPVDATVQVHACHGRARQVQVLRDELLRLLAADPTLRPRDVVVMCPDVEAYAPLVHAHLAVPPDDPDGRPDLRVRLADRALRQVNPVLRAVDDLLDLAAGRLTATRLLDLAGSAPVRTRFAFDDEDLDVLGRTVVDAGIRWGLDQADRRRDGVSHPDGTVLRGTTRALLGVAMADEDDRTVSGVTPLGSVDPSAVPALGRFAELVSRLGAALADLRRDQPVEGWVDAISRAADRLLRAPDDQPWQRTQLADVLEDVLAAARGGGAAPSTPITLHEVRGLLADRLRGRPTFADHRTGDLTVCTLVPMRSVPHRVVCLLGMDDEDFPRRPLAPADDLVGAQPRVGDRDRRSEDRQLLLDALMAAGDHLLITHTGVDERSGRPQAPCVPVAELLRVVDAATGRPGAVVTTHPLHPHDPAAFAPSRPGFDPQAHAGAAALRRPPRPAAPPAPLAVAPPDVVALDDLLLAVRDPAALFYRRTVRAALPEGTELPDEQVPLVLDPLVEWQVGDALLRRPPQDRDRVLAAARGRGLLPPPPFGERKLDGVQRDVDRLRRLAAQLQVDVTASGHVELDVALAGGRRLVGSVGQVDGCCHVAAGYSRVQGKHLAAAWVRLLALAVADPAQPWQAVVIGRHKDRKAQQGSAPHGLRLPPFGAAPEVRAQAAGDLLADLVALHDEALAEPLVAPAAAASAYAQAVLEGADPAAADAAAAACWDPDEHRPGQRDADSPAHVLRYGDAVSFEVPAAEPPRPGDVARVGPQPHRFAALALRIWQPLLTHVTEAGL
jgi:exodeoxyribonuclease V gamma subunit